MPWHAKLAPIEPRYYNRVYLGYEWNAHNQLHYTQDNPPPKVVRGYKFNLFYPDLVNNQLAPRYRVEPDIRDKARLLVRFSAGPPYVDVVFGIEDRGEWEVQRGFKSSFEKGVLSLWFRFKKDFRR